VKVLAKSLAVPSIFDPDFLISARSARVLDRLASSITSKLRALQLLLGQPQPVPIQRFDAAQYTT
jgi:hypothetical protein